MIWSWAFAGVMIVFAVAAFAWNAHERRRLDAALRSCPDEVLVQLSRRPLDGRQRRWVNAEGRRRGMEL